MATIKFLLAIFAFTLSLQVLKAEEYYAKETTKPPEFNPLENLILNQNQNGPKPESLARVKRQYGPYYGRPYPDYYPVPIILPLGFGGFGGGFGGRGFGGRGFGGGFGGRGFEGRGFGGRGFGGRGFGGRGIGGGFGGRGIGGGFGG